MKLRLVSGPPLKWFGSKWSLAPWLIRHFPRHSAFVEVFGGGASVLLRKPPSKIEVYNDIYGAVVEFFRVLRENGEELTRLVELTPYAKAEHALSFEEADAPLERARRFVVRSWQTRGGYRRSVRSAWWRMRTPGARCNTPAASWQRVPQRLRETAQRLRDVHIECADWREIFERYDTADTLFYLDPPYLTSTRAARYEYHHEMEVEEHRALLRAAKKLEGAVLLSGYQSDIYAEELQGWRCVTKDVRTQSGKVRTEALWLNPAAQARVRARGKQKKLFAS